MKPQDRPRRRRSLVNNNWYHQVFAPSGWNGTCQDSLSALRVPMCPSPCAHCSSGISRVDRQTVPSLPYSLWSPVCELRKPLQGQDHGCRTKGYPYLEGSTKPPAMALHLTPGAQGILFKMHSHRPWPQKLRSKSL